MSAIRDGLGAEPADLSSHVAVEDLPSEVDWRTKNVVTPAKDQVVLPRIAVRCCQVSLNCLSQGGCGSCWAFSTAETLESHIAIQARKRGRPLITASVPKIRTLFHSCSRPASSSSSRRSSSSRACPTRCSAAAPAAVRAPPSGACVRFMCEQRTRPTTWHLAWRTTCPFGWPIVHRVGLRCVWHVCAAAACCVVPCRVV
jgi:hypothetical protein